MTNTQNRELPEYVHSMWESILDGCQDGNITTGDAYRMKHELFREVSFLLAHQRERLIERVKQRISQAEQVGLAEGFAQALENVDDHIDGMGMGGTSGEAKGFNLAIEMVMDNLEGLSLSDQKDEQ